MASRIVRARLDNASERALAVLRAAGLNESEAVRAALVEAAERRRRRSALRDEVARIAADPDDAHERAAVIRDMDSIAAELPPD